MLIVVNYHYVRPTFDAPHAGIHGITPAQLEAQLRVLGMVAEFVSGEQVRDAVRGAGRLPSRAMLVTFDDGLREQFEHGLPVLERLGIPGLFFVNTQPVVQQTVSTVHKVHLLRAYTAPERFSELLHRTAVARGAVFAFDGGSDQAAGRQYRYDTPADARLKYLLNFQLAPEVRDGVVSSCFRAVFGDDERAISTRLYMDVGQLRELGSRRAVGTHGHDHVPLGRCSRAAVQESVRRSLELLTQWLGYRPYTLSYPYGSQEACTEQAGEGVAAAGIEFAFTMERAGNANLSNPLYLARFECNDLPGGNRAQLGIEELFERVARASWYRAPVHAPREPRPAGPVAGERV